MPGAYGKPPIDWPSDVRRWNRPPRIGSLIAAMVIIVALFALFFWLGGR